ncbi:MAG: M14 family zinc carboxypeptidase [Candidatus Delongbacteria bacterium]|nr:M14 family zinc carboxypeptidase [Candidatus Delongbacteria bacterium]
MKTLNNAFCLIFVFSFFVQELYPQSPSIDRIINDRHEAVIVFTCKNPEKLQRINNIITITDVADGRVVAYVNEKQEQALSETGVQYSLYKPYYEKGRAITMATTTAEMASWDKYPTWSVFQEMMLSYANDYPDICRLDTIGFSVEGRAMLVVKISDNITEDEPEPEFFLTGQMHGDELVSYMFPLRMIDYLLSNYGSDDRVDSIINNMELWINPLSNPDGTYGNDENDVSGSTRYNADGIDLNRNFPDFQDGQHPDGNPTATENLAMIDFATERHFVMSANAHSGAELLNYPWDTWETLPADNEWWIDVATTYADQVHQDAASGYLTDQDDGVTNGYAWYTANGTRQDYMNYYHHCRELTMELSTDKLLDAELLPDHWNYNRDALLGYFEEALEGIHGIVTDSITGDPLEARVFIEGHDVHNSHVFSFLPYGDYHRLLDTGEWNISFSKAGYKTKTLAFDLIEGETINQELQLVPLGILPPYPDFSATQTELTCVNQIQFFNETEGAGDISYIWDFGDGQTDTAENPVHAFYQNGYYTVSLVAENENGSNIETKENHVHVNLPQLDSVHNASVCADSGSMELRAYSNGDVHWYDSLFSDTPVSQGEMFATPMIYEPHTYYAEAAFSGTSGTVGEPDDSEGGEYNYDDVEHGLIFDVFQTCIIDSITVYAENPGERTISIKDSIGNAVAEKIVNVPAGEQTISLDFMVFPGNNYQLAASADCGFLRGQTGIWSSFDYPYAFDNVLSITDADMGEGWYSSDKLYPYFYNWHVSTPDCYSVRTPVYAALNNDPIADFTSDISGLTIEFENTSQFATDYLWDFGDGQNSTVVSPQHVYDAPGEYTVELNAFNDCGSHAYSRLLTVEETGFKEDGLGGIKIFPNPAENFVILCVENGLINSELNIINMNGKIVFSKTISESDTRIDLSEMNTGLYIMHILNDDKNRKIKLIIH